MSEDDNFWDLYWEMHLLPMENLGKRAAVLAVSQLIRRLAPLADHPLRLLELGSGDGRIIGSLVEAHAQVCSVQTSLGIDYNALSIARCRQNYPDLPCIPGDFTDTALLAKQGKFDIVILVNALHEVFSDCISPALGQIDVPAAKKRVEEALAAAVSCLKPRAWLALFDGLEPPGDPSQKLRIRFHDKQTRQEFLTFVSDFRALPITYREVDGPFCLELSQHDFARYITKSIFLGKTLWQTERRQSYQYFTQEEFKAAFARQNLQISELHTLTVNEDKWDYRVSIETPGFHFPDEHILILAQLGDGGVTP